MKKNVCFILLAIIIFMPIQAQPASQSDSWIKLSEGICLLPKLTNHSIDIKIKNISDAFKDILRQPSGSLVNIVYINDQGVSVPLEYQKNSNFYDTEKSTRSMGVPSGGEVAISMSIPISNQQAIFLKTHQVIFSMIVEAKPTEKAVTVTSSPLILKTE